MDTRETEFIIVTHLAWGKRDRGVGKAEITCGYTVRTRYLDSLVNIQFTRIGMGKKHKLTRTAATAWCPITISGQIVSTFHTITIDIILFRTCFREAAVVCASAGLLASADNGIGASLGNEIGITCDFTKIAT